MCSTTSPEAQLLAALTAVERSEPGLCERPARVTALARAVIRAEALYLRELGQADASGELEIDGAGSSVAWVRRETGRSQSDAAADVRLAQRLRQLPVLTAAFVAGDLPRRSVDLVARVALELPEELVSATEPAMVDAARLMGHEDLRRYLAEKVASLAPERLKDAVRTAFERRRTFLDAVGDMGDLRASMQPLDAELLDAVLNALMESDRREGDDRTTPQRRYDALMLMVQMVSELPEMPQVRGARPHLVVIKTEDEPAHTIGGHVLTEGQLDLVTCTATVTPVVVDSGRRPLDVGRSSRSLSTRLWLAVVVRDDGHCQVAGCHAVASRCVPHHIVPWRLGGGTDLHNLVLLCVAHHHALHDREIQLLLYDGRRLTPTGSLPVGAPTPPPTRSLAA